MLSTARSAGVHLFQAVAHRRVQQMFSKSSFSYSKLTDKFNAKGVARNRADIMVTNQKKRIQAIQELFKQLLPLVDTKEGEKTPTKTEIKRAVMHMDEEYPKLLRAIINTSLEAEPAAGRQTSIKTLVDSLRLLVLVLNSPGLREVLSEKRRRDIKLELYPAWFTWEARGLIYQLVDEVCSGFSTEPNETVAKHKDSLLKILPNLCTLGEIERNQKFALEKGVVESAGHTLKSISEGDGAISATTDSAETQSLVELEELRRRLSEVIDGRKLSYLSESPIGDADFVTADDLISSGLEEKEQSEAVETQESRPLESAVLRTGDLLVRVFESLDRRELFAVTTTLKLCRTNHKLLVDLTCSRVHSQFDALPLETVLQTLQLTSQFFGLNVLTMLYRLRNKFAPRLAAGDVTPDQLVNMFALFSKHRLVNFDDFMFCLVARLRSPETLRRLSKFRLPYVAFLLAKSPFADSRDFLLYVQHYNLAPVGNVKFILRGLAVRGQFLSADQIQFVLAVIKEGLHHADTLPGLAALPSVAGDNPDRQSPQKTVASTNDIAVLAEIAKKLSSGEWGASPAKPTPAPENSWRTLLSQLLAVN